MVPRNRGRRRRLGGVIRLGRSVGGIIRDRHRSNSVSGDRRFGVFALGSGKEYDQGQSQHGGGSQQKNPALSARRGVPANSLGGSRFFFGETALFTGADLFQGIIEFAHAAAYHSEGRLSAESTLSVSGRSSFT